MLRLDAFDTAQDSVLFAPDAIDLGEAVKLVMAGAGWLELSLQPPPCPHDTERKSIAAPANRWRALIGNALRHDMENPQKTIVVMERAGLSVLAADPSVQS